MTTQNPKRKKNIHFKNWKKTRSSKGSALTKLLSTKDARRRPDEAIHEAERFLSNIFSSIQDGINILDIDLNILRVNQVMEHWYSHAMPLIGKKCYEAYYGRKERCDVCPTYQTINTGKSVYEVVPKTGANGEIVGWFDLYSFPLIDNITGKMKGVIEYVRDITELTQAEEALRESKERFRSLVESENDAIFTLSLTGTITSLNFAFEKITGWTCTDWIGKPFTSIIHPDDMQTATELYQRILNGEILPRFELRVLLKSGGYGFGEFTITTLMKKGIAEGFLGIARDITERKQAEETLRSERDKFRGMLSAISDGLDIINKNYIIEFQNKFLREYYGDRVGEKCYAAYMGLKRPCNFCSIQEAIGSGNPRRIELVAPNGKNYELSSSPFKDVDGEVKVIELVRDITEHKQAEEALRQESSFRNAIIEHATEGLCVSHEIAEFPYVTFTVWNDRMIEITGYTMEEINRLGWYQTMYPDPEVRVRAIERMARMRQGDDIVGEDWEVTRADGEKRMLSISTSVLQTDDGIVHVLALMHDMTERKNAEEALRESEEKYRGILENIADGYYEVDLAGNLTFFNDSVIQLLGYTKEELMGKNNREYMDRENAETLYQTFNRVYRTGVPSKGFDWEIIRKDGTRRNIEASVSLVKNPSSQPIGFHGIVRDITEHKEADIALHKLNEILQVEIAERKRVEERLEKLNECMLGFGTDSDENINQLVALCGEQLQATCALYNRLENGMLHSIGQWHTPPDFPPKDKPNGHICYDLIQGSNNDIRIIRNLQKTAYAKTDPNVVCYNLKTYVGMPVSFEGTFVGSLCVVYQEDYLPNEDDKKFLGIIASAIGVEEERKRSDEALRESESRLRIILDSIQAGILIIDPETHTIVDLNPAAVKLIGAPKEKIVDSICHQYICPAEMGKCPITDLKQNIENKERLLLTANGKSHPIIKTVFPIVMGGREYLLETFIDITERKQAEENLKESEEKYRLLVEESLQGIVVAQGIPPRLVFANPAMTMILGYTYEELSSLSPKEIESLVHPEDRAFFFKNYKSRLEGKSVLPRYEIRGIRKDGSLVWLELSSTRIEYKGQPAVQAAFLDITERKRAEGALRESEERYRTILENIEDGYYEVDLPGNFTFFNDSLCRMLGYSRNEMIGMGNQQYTDEENRKILFQAFNEVYRTGKPTKAFDWEVIRKDGAEVFGEVSVSLIKDSNGQPIGFRGIARDITQRKRTEEEIKRTLSLLNATLESTADGILVVNREGKMVTFNQKFVQMWGIPESVIATQDDNQALAFVLNQLKDPESFLAKVRELYSQPTADSFDFIEFKDGRVFERYSQPQLIGEQSVGRVWSFRDVTERKKAEESLLTEKQRFQTLTEQAPFGMVMIDQDGTFRYMNPKFKELFGYDLTDISDGKTWFRKAYPDPTYRHQVIQAWINDLKNSKPGEKRSQIFTVICKDGTEKTIDFIPVQLETGENLMACEDITERKQAEEALSESEERFRAMTVTAADAITVMDNHGRITYWNPAAERMFSYTPQEAIGKELHIFLAPERYHEAYKKGFEKFRHTGQGPAINNTIEFIALRKDGTEFPMEVSTSAFKLKGQWHAVGIIRDITERKRSEEFLEKSEMRFMELFNDAPVGYFEYNVEGFITNVNRTYLEMLGYKFEEMIGQPVWKFIVEEEVARQQILGKLAGTMPPGRGIERTYRRRDGSLLPVLIEDRLLKNSAGKITGIRTTIHDITERKHAEEALRESEAKYRQLVEYAPIGIFEIDLNTLKFLNVNDVMCEVMGYSKEEFLSMGPFELLTEESRNLLAEGMGKMLSGEKIPDSAEVKLRTKDKSEFWALVNTKMFYKDGKPFKAQVVAQDISERKKLEEQLIQSQKMEAVGQLAGGIAHDFNNLLTVIKGYGQLSLLDLKESDPLWGNIQEIQKATQRASDLTRQLLAFSRRQILDLKVLNLNSLVRDLNKMLRRIIGEDIELITLLNEDLGRVKVDPGQIEQMILNLAVNARDAMPSGGKLTIETKNAEIDVEYVAAHIGLTPGRYVRLSVSDTGVGMSQEIVEKAFEPFFTTKETGKGTGLGLSTVYGIVKQSGGSIQVYSEPGLGTMFNIFLPRVEENLDALNLREESDFSPKGSETVLLVEDESSVRNLANRILCQQGYTVLEAINGDEALRIVQEGFGKKIDLLLTDVVMPRMSGKELADRIKTLKPELKVLFTSGYTDDAIVHHGVLAPGTHFLQKPFSFKSLSCKVREVLDR